ncbi:CS1-pili formation C-terminal domain-containing protein [Vibrio rumoiensis]|uniref:CS1-pili formation C-terminal domain-containing protein n=1 Tax=Vibrio rumoiensis TaxID=76258 RepID=A0ABW7J040_9VIBR
MRSQFAIAIAIGFIPFAKANYIPEGFEHFYDFKKNELRFLLPNETEEVIKVESNFRQVKTIVDSEKLSNALRESGVKDEKIDGVLNSIINSDKASDVKAMYSYDDKTVKVSVPASYMREQTGQLDFTSMQPDANALILTNRLYSNGYNGSYNASLNTEATLGLASSHFNFNGDFTIDEDNSDYDVQMASYQYDLQGRSLVVGYSEYTSLIDNSTSLMDYSQGSDEYSVSLFSNDNLLLKDINNGKKIYFDMKAPGTVELLRDGSVIYSDSVGQGQKTIDYKRLPKGNYSAQLVLKPNGYAKEVYNKRINNNASQTSLRGYDYAFSLSNAESERGENRYEVNYFNSSGVLQLWEGRILVGAGLQASDDAVHIGSGVKYIDGSFNASAYATYLYDGYLYSLSGNWAGMSLDYESLHLNDSDVSDLTGARYGDEDYSQLTLAYSTNVGFGNLSFYVNKYYEENNNTAYKSNDIDTLNLSANFHTTLFVNVGLDVGYTSTRDFSSSARDERTITTSFSIPLSDIFDYSSSFEHSNLTGYRLTNNIRYNDSVYQNKDMTVNAGLNAAEYLDGNDSQMSIGGDISANSKYFDAHAFANISDDDYQNISADIESTSVITNNNIYMTSERSNSYLILNNDVSENIDSSDLGLVNVHSLSGSNSRELVSDNYTLIGLDEYSKYKFNLDSEVSGFNSESKPIGSMYSYPGTVKTVDNKLKKVKTFLTYFEDFNDSPLNDVDCVGDGCVSVSRVGDGVYSISVQEGENFKLTSNNQMCNFSFDNDSKYVSRCFPQIKEQVDGMQLVVHGLGNDSDKVYYLGIIEKNFLDGMSTSLNNLNVDIFSYKFNGQEHIFAKLNAEENKNQIEFLNQLQQYAISGDLDGKYSKVW